MNFRSWPAARGAHIELRPRCACVAREAHPGDGFLFERGFTVASIGWQWDVFRSDALMGLDAPHGMRDGLPVGGETMVEIRPSASVKSWQLSDRTHKPLPVAAGSENRAVLYVRDYEDGPDETVPRERWRFARQSACGGVVASAEHLYVDDGFIPGRIYQVVYETDRAPIAGLGLLALRDVAPFLRRAGHDNPIQGDVRTLIAWGISQTGRFLRHFLSLGLNVCEDGSIAHDGIAAHVAGARRGAFNHRFAQPSNQTTPLWGHVFPFADLATEDPLSGRRAGLLDSLAAAGAVPRIISTDTGAEYWRGDASLAHIDTRGEEDLPEHRLTRRYLFSSTQHVPGYIGQSRTNAGVGTTARYPINLLDYRPLLRAALINLDRWITEDISPPPSQHPRLRDATAVPRDRVLSYYATLPGFVPPAAERLPFVRTVDLGASEDIGVGRYPPCEGAFYPALVSAVDEDGNELAGVRLPDVTVPVGSHAGWNPRDPETGAPDQIVPMNGLSLLFAADAVSRQRAGDPRLSLAERYRDEADYEAKIRAACADLVSQGYLLAEDTQRAVDAALERYRAAVGCTAPGADGR
ncbi:MAG: alpha/beta hydrolase domain-containing protein [Hyphomicrobiaceae bacterium]